MKKVFLALLKLLAKVKVFKSSCCSCECKTKDDCYCENDTKI